jgi:hypothetical protein
MAEFERLAAIIERLEAKTEAIQQKMVVSQENMEANMDNASQKRTAAMETSIRSEFEEAINNRVVL